jgi:TatD DNase family protein
MSDTPNIEWIDAHCHLEYRSGENGAGQPIQQLSEQVDDAVAAGVTTLIDVGTDRERSSLTVEHAAADARVWATVGLHPHDASNGWGWIEDAASDAAQRRIVGVGECGLDYYYDHSPRELQRECFAAQIGIAHRSGLALVIHTRDAWDDTFAILRSEGVPARTVFHCFTGGPAEAESALALHDGVMLSFSGIVSFPSATDLQAAALMCPLDRFTVETDSPYLAPVPYRGKKNRPSWVPHVGAAVAKVKSLSVEEIARASTANARRLFALPT